jgi:hypothetical protein
MKLIISTCFSAIFAAILCTRSRHYILHDATNESVSHSLKVSILNVFRSPDILSSSQEFYLSTIADVIEKMAHGTIHIRLIVGDGFSLCSIACPRRPARQFKIVRTISSNAPP